LLSFKPPISQAAGHQIESHSLEGVKIAEELKRLLVEGPPPWTTRGERYKTHHECEGLRFGQRARINGEEKPIIR